MQRVKRNWLRLTVHLSALARLGILAYAYQAHHLTFNPIQAAEQQTGTAALVLLVLSLVCSPLNTVLGWKQAIQARRPLGLWAFGFAALHVSIFTLVDYGLDLSLLLQAVTEKPYIIVGLTAFVLLVPLAFTSTRGWMRRLGKRWVQLHRLIYLIAPLVVVHYFWSVKADIRPPLLYGAGLAVLFLLRLPPIKRAIRRLRYRHSGPRRSTAKQQLPSSPE